MAPRDRCPMGPDSPPSPCGRTFPEGGPSPRRCPALFRRDALDSVDRRPLERTAQAVWQPEYLLETAAAVGSERDTPCALAGLTGPIE